LSHATAPERSGSKALSRDAGSFTHFFLGIFLGTAGALAAQALTGGPSNKPVENSEGEEQTELDGGSAGEGAPLDQGPQGGQTTPPSGKIDSTSPWFHFWIGAAMAAVVTAIAIWLSVAYPAAKDNARLLLTYWAFMFVPGLSLAGLGLYMLRQQRRGLVMYALNRHDYLAMALQFFPGTAISVLGNLLPSDLKVIGLSISWVSIILGTGVSIMVVRKFGKP
jgi:hypothetical protein